MDTSPKRRGSILVETSEPASPGILHPGADSLQELPARIKTVLILSDGIYFENVIFEDYSDFGGAWRVNTRHAPPKSDITFLTVT